MMALYRTQSELEAEGHDINAIVLDILERRESGATGNPLYDKYADCVYLGGNEKEGRAEAYIFMTNSEFNTWLDLQ